MRIAILEDDLAMGEALQTWLDAAGHACHWFKSGKHAQREIGRESFDLFVLDWQVPDVPGIELLRWMREVRKLTQPVLFVTSRDAEEDIVTALTNGADDYLVKPVRRLEVLARIAALGRRAQPAQSVAALIELGPLRADPASRQLTLNGVVQELTDKEFTLILLLMRNPGQLLSRGHLTESVWGRSDDIPTRTLDTHVSRLRRKLGLVTEHGFRLTSVYGFGYRLERTSPDQAV